MPDLVHAKKAIYIRELCEFPYGTSKETKRNIRLRKIVLQKQFPKCDGFIAISETLKELAYKYKSSQAVVTKIPILVDFAKYNLPNYSYKASVPYIFHSGRPGKKNTGQTSGSAGNLQSERPILYQNDLNTRDEWLLHIYCPYSGRCPYRSVERIRKSRRFDFP